MGDLILFRNSPKVIIFDDHVVEHAVVLFSLEIPFKWARDIFSIQLKWARDTYNFKKGSKVQFSGNVIISIPQNILLAAILIS